MINILIIYKDRKSHSLANSTLQRYYNSNENKSYKLSIYCADGKNSHNFEKYIKMNRFHVIYVPQICTKEIAIMEFLDQSYLSFEKEDLCGYHAKNCDFEYSLFEEIESSIFLRNFDKIPIYGLSFGKVEIKEVYRTDYIYYYSNYGYVLTGVEAKRRLLEEKVGVINYKNDKISEYNNKINIIKNEIKAIEDEINEEIK